ncbi:MAG TPA: extracellular solute-binding protein, partial [Acidobacteriota bacterium]|nr:extracellular solute-binding protein [Acidobacteriota bacterium]
NVRQVLDYIARNEVEAGFIYASDVVIASESIEIAATAPAGTHSPISYPIAVVQATENLPASREFIDLVLGASGQQILEEYGFTGAPTP